MQRLQGGRSLKATVCFASLVGIHQRAADKQRLEASTRRAVRSGLYAADDPSFSQLVADMDDNLFAKIRHNPHHVLYKLLPESHLQSPTALSFLLINR